MGLQPVGLQPVPRLSPLVLAAIPSLPLLVYPWCHQCLDCHQVLVLYKYSLPNLECWVPSQNYNTFLKLVFWLYHYFTTKVCVCSISCNCLIPSGMPPPHIPGMPPGFPGAGMMNHSLPGLAGLLPPRFPPVLPGSTVSGVHAQRGSW